MNDFIEFLFGIGILFLFIWLFFNYYIAKQFQQAAEDKGYKEGKYLWICFFLGIIGYLLVIALPNKNTAVVTSSGGTETPFINNTPQGNVQSTVNDELPEL